MKVFALLVLGALVGAAGYLFGTEAGRQHKDVLVGKIRKGADSASDVIDDVVDRASDAVSDATDTAKDAAKDAKAAAKDAAGSAKDAVDQIAS